jgi:hypothetical protein
MGSQTNSLKAFLVCLRRYLRSHRNSTRFTHRTLISGLPRAMFKRVLPEPVACPTVSLCAYATRDPGFGPSQEGTMRIVQRMTLQRWPQECCAQCTGRDEIERGTVRFRWEQCVSLRVSSFRALRGPN